MDDDYVISEDPIGLVSLPNTTADTIVSVIKDLLIRCILPLPLCRGQAYDGASAMQGRKKGVATQIREEVPAALPVHCFAHSLNLCLQDAAKKIKLLRDALETVREIVKLINFSPKRKHLLSTKLCNDEGVTLKPLCPTRWTVRTGAIDAVLKDYTILMDTMEEVSRTTHDEYGVKANGILSILEKFETLFGLRLGHLLFGPAEEVSKTLQGKDTSIQEAVSAVRLGKRFYERQREDKEFDRFYDRVVEEANHLKIGEPKLPRYRRAPARLDDGSQPHTYRTPKDYFRRQYFEACDLLIGELEDRFEQKGLMEHVLLLESLLLKAANGNDCSTELNEIDKSLYKDDLDIDRLRRQILLLVDVIRVGVPSVKEVTSVRTICDAMNHEHAYKTTLSEVHKLLRLFLTIPLTSSTAERTFSVLRRLLTYLRSTMTEQRLNNCLLLHTHKDLTDNIDLLAIAKEFIAVGVTNERRNYFGVFPE